MRKIHAMALIVALIFITSWVFALRSPSPAKHAVTALGVSHVRMDPFEMGG